MHRDEHVCVCNFWRASHPGCLAAVRGAVEEQLTHSYRISTRPCSGKRRPTLPGILHRPVGQCVPDGQTNVGLGAVGLSGRLSDTNALHTTTPTHMALPSTSKYLIRPPRRHADFGLCL